jgi:hypothetical protein
MPDESDVGIEDACVNFIRDMWIWSRRQGFYNVTLERAHFMMGGPTPEYRWWWIRALVESGFLRVNARRCIEVLDNAAYLPWHAKSIARSYHRDPPVIPDDLADRAKMYARSIDRVEQEKDDANIRRALRQWRGTKSDETPEPIADAEPFKSLGRPSVSVEQYQRNLAACEADNAAVRARIEARFAQQVRPAQNEGKSV